MNIRRLTLSIWLLLTPIAATAEDAPVEPFPFSVVTVHEPIESDPSSDAAAAFADHSYLTPPDLQGLAKRVTFFSLVVVLACGAIIVFANKRASKRGVDSGQLHVVETISLAPRCFCDLVKVRGQFFVVARDANGLKEMRQVGDFSDAFTEFTSGTTEPPIEELAHGAVVGQ